MPDTEHRVAIVTGAGGGLGSETARLLARDGLALVLVDSDEASLRDLVESLDGRNLPVLPLVADVAGVRACEQIVQQALEEFHRVDVLVNCAAVLERHELEEFTEDDFTRTFLVNTGPAFFLTRAAMRDMTRRRWGRVVNVTSTGVYEGGFTMTSSLYEASKGAVAVLTKMFAKYGASNGILVNSLCPGGMRTRMLTEQTPLELIDRAERELIPLGRLAEPYEMATMIRWLVSDDNSYATGAEFDITGGLALH